MIGWLEHFVAAGLGRVNERHLWFLALSLFSTPWQVAARSASHAINRLEIFS